MIIKNNEQALRVKCEDVTPEEAGELIERLEKELEYSASIGSPGIGLAAPQIGIAKKAAIVRVGKPEYDINLINCSVTKGWDMATFEGEGCLSFPGRIETTNRYQEVLIENNLVMPERMTVTGLFAVVCQHECLPYDSIVHTETGFRKIGDIVKNKDYCNVWCLNNDNEFVLSKITSFSKMKNVDKMWVLLEISKGGTGPNKKLVCTSDHRCATIDNILKFTKNNIYFTEAKNLKNKYIIRKPTNTQQNKEIGLYNNDQISLIVGSLLGDMCISGAGEISASHGEPQKDYAAHKAFMLNGDVKRGYSGYRDEFSNYVCKAKITEQTKLLRKIAYYNGTKCPTGIFEYVNEISLAYWYMDDGCLLTNKNRLNAQFHTEGFSKKDVQELSYWLRKKFDLESIVSPRKVNNDIKYILILNKESSNKLFSMINKYIIPSMQYKLPEAYRCEYKELSNIRESFSVKKVKKIKRVKRNSYLYDIGVAKYHNFVANNTVVHNCDHFNQSLFIDHIVKKKKVRPNDICPCGTLNHQTGKPLKYKKCCGKKYG